MKSLKYIIVPVILFLMCQTAFADGTKDNPVLRAARSVLTLIDSMSVSGIDRRYIDVPARPWQVVIRGNVNRASLDMSSTIDGGSLFLDLTGNFKSEPHITSGSDLYAGVWAGYRGYGLGYMSHVSGAGKGSLFTLGATGGCYGINFRRHTFETDEFDVYTQGQKIDGTPIDTTMAAFVFRPIRVKSFILDGYYMFNSRRFSYAAAYDQSAYQLRSAGSLMVGAMYYYSHINYEDPLNADMILNMDNIGRMRQWQVSLGGGYAYNYVPVRGVLISGMLMPMLTFYNRMKIYRYDSKMRQMAEAEETFDEEDAAALLRDVLSNPAAMQLKPDTQRPVETQTSRVALNFNARASLTYNLGEWSYVNVFGQLYNFRFSHEQNHGALTEWFVNAALGLRF